MEKSLGRSIVASSTRKIMMGKNHHVKAINTLVKLGKRVKLYIYLERVNIEMGR